MHPQYDSLTVGITLPLIASIAGKAMCILALGLLAVVTFKRSSAASKHWVLLLTLTAAAAIPFLTLAIPRWKVLPNLSEDEKPVTRQIDGYWIPSDHLGYPIPSESPVGKGSTIAAPVSESSSPSPTSAATTVESIPSNRESFRFSLPFALTLVWLIGTVCCLAFAGFSMISLMLLTRRSIPFPSAPLLSTVELLKGDLRMRGQIEIHLIKRGSMPMVWALRHGHLYLPAEAIQWSKRKLEAVITHELAHLKRGDTWSLLVGFAATSIHWFNPFAWLALRALRNEQEKACDDLVLSRDLSPSDYAEQILEMSSTLAISQAHLPAAGMARGASLYERLAAIVDAGRKRHPLTRRTLLSTGIVAAVLVVPVSIIGAAEMLTKTGRGRILDRNGVVLAEDASDGTRRYPLGRLAAQHIGVSTKSDSDIIARGRFGIEEMFDRQLREGNDIPTTLDVRMQNAVEAVFQETGIQQGSMIIMDARKGDILASISLPNFDLNSPDPQVVTKAKTSPTTVSPVWLSDSSIFRDRNYSVASVGSLFQLIPAISASQHGMASNKHRCVSPYETGEDSKCWVADLRESKAGSPPVWNSVPWHGVQNLETATKNSCGSYFHQLGVSVGINDLVGTADLLLKVESGFNSRGRASFAPPIFGKSAVGKFHGEDQIATSELIAKCVMGNSSVSYAAPVHMVNMVAAIGNGGLLIHPRYSTAVTPQIRENLLQDNISFKAAKREDLDAICRGMELSMSERSSATSPARSSKISIVGKSASISRVTQSGKPRTYSWFIGYAAAGDSQLAFVVMIENPNSESQNPAAIAKRILETTASPGAETSK